MNYKYTHEAAASRNNITQQISAPDSRNNNPITPPIDMNSDDTATSGSSSGTGSNHVLAYVLLPLGSLAFIALLSFVVVFVLKKSRLDRLRHQLMPLYSFDPAEEEGDWESELLEEDKEQQMALNIGSPSPTDSGPQLKFHTETLDI